MKIKQTMVLTLSSLMLVSAFTATPIAKVEAATKAETFVDVDKENPHYEGIMYWSKENVINGYPTKNNKKEYRPWDKISREHTAVLFNRGLNLSIPDPEGVKEILKDVSDVSEDHVYAGQIASMYRDKIFGGKDGKFLGQQSLNREQMATVLVGAFDLKSGKNKTKVNMKNVDKSHQKNVQILSDLDIYN